MAAATSIITEASPYIVRTSFTLPQVVGADGRLGAQERHQEGRHAGHRLRPRHRRREVLQRALQGRRRHRSSRTCACRCATPTSRRSCRRCATPSPTRCSSSCRRAPARSSMKQFVERGLDKAGIKLIATGDVTDDDQLNDMGDVGARRRHLAPLLGRRTQSPANKKFVEAFKKANNGMRPNFMAVGGYDGMHLIYEALKKTKRRGRRRRAARGDEGHGLREPARPDLDRSRRPATSCRTSTSARSRRWTASSTTSSSHHPERQGPGEGREEARAERRWARSPPRRCEPAGCR